MTDHELLRDVGPALYGPLWHAALAHDLDVSWGTMRRWITGEAVPAGGLGRAQGSCCRLACSRLERAIEALRRPKAP
jgi:hypothetical protein